MIVAAARWEVTMARPIRISPDEIDTSTRDLHLYQAYGAALAWCHTARTRLGGPDRVADRGPVRRWLAAIGLDAAAARDLLHRAGLGCHGSGTDLAGERVPPATLHRVRRTLY
jgi:hypothetical protein